MILVLRDMVLPPFVFRALVQGIFAICVLPVRVTLSGIARVKAILFSCAQRSSEPIQRPATPSWKAPARCLAGRKARSGPAGQKRWECRFGRLQSVTP